MCAWVWGEFRGNPRYFGAVVRLLEVDVGLLTILCLLDRWLDYSSEATGTECISHEQVDEAPASCPTWWPAEFDDGQAAWPVRGGLEYAGWYRVLGAIGSDDDALDAAYAAAVRYLVSRPVWDRSPAFVGGHG
ncbi:hypothetical protein MNVI_34880 [Mycobacterium noviomagense]|uniref:Uncharacterized protein n=1 Tax=Mycobacterium noviomagense TaxID=459858 RepID=A0A7I7PI45_9MYCO|nr:hypothetical protein MNVI_34880 [Mycobacterium noviomagense]